MATAKTTRKTTRKSAPKAAPIGAEMAASPEAAEAAPATATPAKAAPVVRARRHSYPSDVLQLADTCPATAGASQYWEALTKLHAKCTADGTPFTGKLVGEELGRRTLRRSTRAGCFKGWGADTETGNWGPVAAE